MLKQPQLCRDLVLVGGGHAHALALRMLAMKPVSGLRVTLVSPASHTPYSGMLPGLVAGHYTFTDSHIDLVRLCQWAGVRFIRAEITGLDLARRELTLPGRAPLGYDVLSLDIGSQPELDSVPGAREHATPVKPVAALWQRWQNLELALKEQPPGQPLQLAVVGGGAGGVELALAMAHRLRDAPVALALFCAGPDILPGYNRCSRRAARRALDEAGIVLHCYSRVQRVEATTLEFDDGASAPFDTLFWCTGAAAATWIADSGLATDKQGFVAVHDTLQATSDDSVFAVGDIATQLAHPRPKAGVYAVRQAPVLAHNLRNILLGRPLRTHRPQREFLSLLSLGRRRAIADRGPFSVTGDWVWRWKDRIDRKFMDQFAHLPPVMPAGVTDVLPDTESAASQAPCGGCGAKVGGDSLRFALRQLRSRYPQLCPDPEAADDAAIMPVPPGGIQLQSIDILRALVGDPWLMGRIAANHALSDLYASGARPLAALAAVTLPFASPALQQRELVQLLGGALAEFARVNCQLVGGHSLQGPELAIGFAVQGAPLDASGRLLHKRGLRDDDLLLLTKPLGTGTLFAGLMQNRADGRDISAAIEMMLQSNFEAAGLALAHGVEGATDVTGFGLVGHLLEMLGPEQGAALERAALPALPGALANLQAGIYSTMHADNARLGEHTATPDPRRDLLLDPQTSGGLLLGVTPALAGPLRAALQAAGYGDAAVIGKVNRRPDTGERIQLD
ncbi:selenide, water dikinase SelD [Kineobactrum sediminis]|uniref:Selenide, water dikinase SelD n=1 Tax=Kineobactrum sediminis TaxID=1905677 RepID=A0A2N5Y7H6_9GAMM|nr:selenide, water dikinase SelD [Kineobactrum sediminis]PLW84329.1 selenide, water dikinase SelD [Kineobactrum sediminis]